MPTTKRTAPLATVPLATVPLAAVPLAAVPLAAVPLAAVFLATALLTTLLSTTACRTIARLTRLPSGAMRSAPPENIEDRALKVGTMAPEIQLQTDGGQSFSLKEATQKGPVVLVFYRGDWCPICARQLREIAKHESELRASGATVIALSPDSAELSLAFAEDNAWPFSTLVDDDLKVIKSYGLFDPENASAWPTIYVIDRDGIIRYRGLSETKDERPTSKDVLAALAAVSP